MGLLWVSTIFTAMGVFGTRSNSVWLVSVVVVLGGLGMGAINGLEPAQRTGNACFGYGEGDYTCCPSGVSKSCADGLCYTLWDQRAAAPILPHPPARSDQFEAHGLDPLKLQARERERRRRQRAGRLGGARHRAPHGPSAVDLAGQRAGRLRNHLRDASNYLCNTTCSLRVPPRARAAPRAASSLVNQATPACPL